MTASQPILPRALRPGDTIGLFCPSEPLTEDRQERVAKGVRLFENLGYRVREGANLYKRSFYMAGTRQERAEDINELLHDHRVRALWTAWGGKSANQILDLIDWDQMIKDPKLVIGFSDTTNLVNAVNARTGIVAFHGPHVAGKIAECSQSTIDRAFRAFCHGKVELPDNVDDAVIVREGRCEGQLVGGNLKSFVLANLGTAFQPNIEGAVLFWETGSGSPQEIDQFLSYLRLAGVFDRIVGMVVGDVSNCKDSRDWGGRDILEIVRCATSDTPFPVLHLKAFGHGPVPNMVLPIGVRARLDTATRSVTVLGECVQTGETNG